MGTVSVGDFVYDDKGLPTRIIATSEVMTERPCYEILFSSKETIVADEQHLWWTETYAERNSRTDRSSERIGSERTTREIYDSVLIDGKLNHAIRIGFISEMIEDSLNHKVPRLKFREAKYTSLRYIKSVTKVNSVPVRCIQVENERGMFLAGRTLIPTHNSRLAGEKVIAVCKMFPNTSALVVRKTRNSLMNSTITSLTNTILFGDTTVRHYPSKARFEFENGSILFYGGMSNDEQLQQLRSIGQDGALDFIWIEEANRATYNDFSELRTRLRGKAMRGKNGKVWQQMVLTTNPDSWRHWINQEFIIPAASTGQGLRIPLDDGREMVRHTMDNPSVSVYQPPFGSNPFNPQEYTDDMLLTKGLTNQRMVAGLWVNAEGLVWPEFDYNTHVILPFELPADWARYVTIDFGYNSPSVCQWWARSPSDELYMYREIYQSNLNDEQLADMVVEYSRTEQVRYAVVDFANQSGASILRNRGISTKNCKKAIERGVQVVAQRLDIDPQIQKPRMMFFADALVQEDRVMKQKHRPICTTEEIEQYQYAEEKLTKNLREIPLQVNDHGCLVGDTLIKTSKGDKKLRAIQVGDFVLTRDGYQKVLESGLTHPRAVIWELHYEWKKGQGSILFGTGDHPVFIQNQGWTPISKCYYGDILEFHDGRFVKVVRRIETKSRRKVYNIKVDDMREYYANGILVHNCDAMRYLAMDLYDRRSDVFSTTLGDLFEQAGL